MDSGCIDIVAVVFIIEVNTDSWIIQNIYNTRKNISLVDKNTRDIFLGW